MSAPAASSRLKVGVDVPWVTSWSEEPQLGVQACPSVDGELAIAQEIKPGVGRPLYSRNHFFRQRKSVRELLCPMCGEPTEAGDRWSQTGHYTTAGELRARGFGPALPPDTADDQRLLNAGAIAPLHRRCAEAALERCPHLGGMEDKVLKAFPTAWVVIPLWVEAKPPAARGPGTPVVSFLQLVGVEAD
jgi:hypothetical protein